MALIREPGRERDLRKGEVRGGEKVLRPSHAASHHVMVRAHALRLLECAGEMIHRQPRGGGQRLDADVVFQMGFDELPQVSQRPGWQAAANPHAQLPGRWDHDPPVGESGLLGNVGCPAYTV